MFALAGPFKLLFHCLDAREAAVVSSLALIKRADVARCSSRASGGGGMRLTEVEAPGGNRQESRARRVGKEKPGVGMDRLFRGMVEAD